MEDIRILLSHAQQRSNVTAALILELALFEFWSTLYFHNSNFEIYGSNPCQ